MWRQDDAAGRRGLYAATDMLVHVVIAELPDGRWDWAVWRSGRGGTCRYGITETRVAAVGGAADALAEAHDELVF